MSLDASVMCTCWKQGIATAPPVPIDCVYLDEEGYLHVDAEKVEAGRDRRPPEARARSLGPGSILRSWLGGAERPERRSEGELFYEWRRTGACLHHDMVFSREYIGRLSLVRAVRECLEEAAADDPSYRDGGRGFPALLAELPTGNCVTTPPERAAAALEDLLRFRATERSGGPDFSRILDPIERILRASVELGNPVRWE